jgi:hypothetical protein
MRIRHDVPAWSALQFHWMRRALSSSMLLWHGLNWRYFTLTPSTNGPSLYYNVSVQSRTLSEKRLQHGL